MNPMFTCVDCGELFESLAPPAETREGDPEPTCGDCLEKMLDGINTEPLDDDTIHRIMSKVVRDTELEEGRINDH